MKLLRACRAVVVVLACTGMVLPTHGIEAAEPSDIGASNKITPSPSVTQDVKLGRQGTLRGVVVDSQGRTRAKSVVTVRQSGGVQRQTFSDANGQFIVTGLRGGMCYAATDAGQRSFRAWAPGAAPPAAVDQIRLAPSQVVQRGQMPIGEFFGSEPFLLGVVIAAAVAIPIAVHNSKSGS